MISMSCSSSAVAANCRWDIVTPSDWQRRNAMENCTAMVMNLAASDPTRPLTDVRRALIEKRLRDRFPYFRTPNHPPYSAMIQRAIGELKEPDGCTEESISKFIGGHYDDLPWCHSTLLNHHLQKLSEYGEIVVTRSNCYLLSDGIINLESTHSSTPGRELVQEMQKQRSKKQCGQAGCCRKDRTKEKTVQGELMEVTCGQFPVQEGHNLVIEGQNLAEEPQSETIEEPHAIQAREQEQQAVPIGDYNQLEGKTLDSEHLDVNQRVVLSPERPPVFNVGVVKELSEFQLQQLPEQSLHICSQQKNLKCNLETETACINLHSKSKQVLMKQQHEHSPLDLPLVELKLQPDFSNSVRHLEVYAWKKSFKSLDALKPLKFVEKLPGMQQLQDKQHVCKKHAISRPELEDVPKNSNKCFEIPKAVNSPGPKLAAVVVPSPEDQLSSEKLCVRRKASKPELPPSTVSLTLPTKQPDGKRKRTKSKSNTIGMEDVSLHSEKIAEIPNTEQCHGSETRPAESCIKEEVQPVKRRKRQKEPQYILALEAVTAARGFLKDRKKQPDISVLEQSSQKNRRGRQLKNRGPKMSTSTPPMTSKTELFSLAGVQCQETGLPYQESSPKPMKIPVDESTQTLEQQASLRGHESMFKSHPTRKPTKQLKQYERQQQVISQKSLPLSKPKRRSSLDSCLASHTEPGQQPVSQNSKRAKEGHYQLTPENSQNWRLCPQQAKSEAAAAEVVLVQDQNEQQQQQLDNHDGERPLEQKFDIAQDVVELSKSHPQDQHEQKLLAPRGRGRPRKCLQNPQQQEKQKKGRGQGKHHREKPDDATIEKQVQEPKRRGRPRKLDK